LNSNSSEVGVMITTNSLKIASHQKMSREQQFDTEIKKFFDVCVKILESHQKSFLTSDNHVLRNLQRYRIIYNMTEVGTHIPYFQNLFRTYRDELLDVLKDDHWLKNENVVIQFGEELEDEDLRRRSEKRKIEISSIYRSAIQLRKTIEESLKGLPDSAQEQTQELIYPEIFLLHLFRVLFSIYPQNKDIQRNIQTLEKDLGVSSQTSTKKTNPLLENLTENAKQIFGNVLPNNLKLPSNEEMSQKLEQAFKDPVVSETLGSTVNSLMNAKNLGEGIGAAMKSLENPKFMDGLFRAVQTLIPKETLDSITKSTEQLKDSGDIKDALGKLGIPTDIDISKMLKEGPGAELLKSIAPVTSPATSPATSPVTSMVTESNQESNLNCEDGVCQLPPLNESSSNVSETTSAATSAATSAVIGDTNFEVGQVKEGKQETSGVNMEQMFQSLMKNIPPELSEMLNKYQSQMLNKEPEKSLIDL
jgi:hypothetical protein